MTGDRPILAMRRAGFKPDCVWVSDFPYPPHNEVTVCVAGDTPELLDLRFLVGVPLVLVDGEVPARVERIAAACSAAKAQRVIANTFDGPAVVRITDTQGVLLWPM